MFRTLGYLFTRLASFIEKKCFEESGRKITRTQQGLTLALGAILYLNGLNGEFAYDDSRAIQSNQDLLPSTPWYKLLQNDYWGTPIGSSNSHGSYRPLTVFTFRLNVLLHGLSPLGFHLVNLLLHLLVTHLYMRFVSYVLNGHRRITLMSTVLFASHPIHVESVTSIVGRADVAAALFYLAALLSYARFVSLSTREARYPPASLLGALLFAALSMLSKEHGITCLAVCAVYHLFVVHRFFPFSLASYRLLLKEPNYGKVRKGLLHLIATTVLLLLLRCLLMSSLPSFAPSDNPASTNSSVIIRSLTFLYLPVFNFWLLLYPRSLSFDWSMDSIPLISSIFDLRNLHSLLFYATLAIILRKIAQFYFLHFQTFSKTPPQLMVSRCNRCDSGQTGSFPTVKISNQQLRVPLFDDNNNNDSAINYNYVNGNLLPYESSPRWVNNNLDSNNNDSTVPNRNALPTLSTTIPQFHTKKATLVGKPSLASPNPARRTLSQVDCLALALALLIIPFLPATNLFFYVGFTIAERILYICSFGSCLLLAVCIESALKLARKSSLFKWTIYASLALLVVTFSMRTVLRNVDWLNEENLYRSGIPINPPKAYGNLANILNAKGKWKEAEWAYRKALQYRPNMADVHYNLGLLLQEQKRYKEALESYHKAVSYRPRMAVAHLNLASVLVLLGHREQAKQVYTFCAQIDGTGLKDVKLHESTKISALYNLGRMYADDGDIEKALEVFQKAVSRMPPYYAAQSLYNVIGEMYAKLNQSKEAEVWFRKSLLLKRDHIPVHLTYAKMLSQLNRTKEADQLFRNAIRISPNDSSIYNHYGNLEYALQVYQRGLEMSPQNFDLVINVANTLRELRQNEEAEKYYKIAVTLKPNDVISYSNLGAIYHLNGKYQLAMENYLQALKIKPQDLITRTNLAKLKQAMSTRSM